MFVEFVVTLFCAHIVVYKNIVNIAGKQVKKDNPKCCWYFQDILKQALDDHLEKATELPYFDGDFWPNTLEDSIKELDQEEEERKASAAAEAAGDMVGIIYCKSSC